MNDDPRPEIRQDDMRAVRLTPPGRSAIAVVRLEGNRLGEILCRHFSVGRKGKSFDFTTACADRDMFSRPLFGLFELACNTDSGRDASPVFEEIVLHLLDATCAELHVHGGEAVIEALERTLFRYGTNMVSWSECLKRDDEPSRHDEMRRIRNEVLQILPRAKTERVAKILLDQYNGALMRERNELFARSGTPETARRLRRIRENAKLGFRLGRPFRVVLFGAVNAGKSSLVNAILGFQRVIADPTPGTTRDAVETETVIDGWPVLLVDTAGMRRAEQALERLGIEKTRSAMRQADLLLHVIDAREVERTLPEIPIPDTDAVPILRVYGKSDLSCENERSFVAKTDSSEKCNEIHVSANTLCGLESLLKRISEMLVPEPPRMLEAVPLNQRQLEYFSIFDEFDEHATSF